MPVPYLTPIAAAALPLSAAPLADADGVLLSVEESLEEPLVEEAVEEGSLALPELEADGLLLAWLLALRAPQVTLWQAVWPERSLGWAAVHWSRHAEQT